VASLEVCPEASEEHSQATESKAQITEEDLVSSPLEDFLPRHLHKI
jgi:hypothetical protein